MTELELEAEKRFRAILENELEFKGVDWLGFLDQDGQLNDERVTAYLNSLIAATGEETRLTSVVDGADLFEPIALDKATFLRETKNLKGDEIKIYILELIETLQKLEKQLDKPVHNIDWELVGKTSAVIGFLAALKYAPVILSYMQEAYSAAALGYALASAVGAGAVAIGVIAAIIAVVIAVLVIVFLMFRDAQMLILVANDSMDNEVHFSDYYRKHGKIKIIPGDVNHVNVLPKGTSKEGSDYIYISFINPGKSTAALRGCEGAFKADIRKGSNSVFSFFQAYQVPLAGWFGGYNGAYVNAAGSYSSSKDFWDKDGRKKVEECLDSDTSGSGCKVNVRASSIKGQQIGAILTMTS